MNDHHQTSPPCVCYAYRMPQPVFSSIIQARQASLYYVHISPLRSTTLLVNFLKQNRATFTSPSSLKRLKSTMFDAQKRHL